MKSEQFFVVGLMEGQRVSFFQCRVRWQPAGTFCVTPAVQSSPSPAPLPTLTWGKLWRQVQCSLCYMFNKEKGNDESQEDERDAESDRDASHSKSLISPQTRAVGSERRPQAALRWAGPTNGLKRVALKVRCWSYWEGEVPAAVGERHWSHGVFLAKNRSRSTHWKRCVL